MPSLVTPPPPQFGAKVAMGLAPSATATVTASETCFMQASNEVNAVGTFQLHRVPRSCPRRSCWKCWEGSLRSDNKSGHGCCEYYTMNIYEYCLDTDWILSGYCLDTDVSIFKVLQSIHSIFGVLEIYYVKT